MAEAFLESHTDWVIDGNYSALFYDRRMAEADQIVQMLFPRLVSLYRVVKRYRRFAGRTRPDLPGDCPEKLDGEFIRWILWDGRRKKARDRYRRIREQYPEKTVVLRSQRQIDDFLSNQ